MVVSQYSLDVFCSGSFRSNNELQLKIKILMDRTPCFQSHLNFLVKEKVLALFQWEG